MQVSKKHHHIPVFYLNRWCDGDGKVHVIRNINGNIVRSRHAPAHLGFEYQLYSYHDDFDAADRAEIETEFFKPLDNEGARIIASMIAGNDLDKRDRVLWTQFITSMKIRTPEMVARIRAEWQAELLRELESTQADYERLKQHGEPENAVDWLRQRRPGFIESFGLGQLPKIASDPKAMQYVLSCDWHVVHFASSTVPLLSSDRPCVYTEGLDKPDCVIALPLSPRHAFFAFRPKSNAQRNLMKTPANGLAAALNRSVVGQAAARAYSQYPHDAPDSFFLKRLLRRS